MMLVVCKKYLGGQILYRSLVPPVKTASLYETLIVKEGILPPTTPRPPKTTTDQQSTMTTAPAQCADSIETRSKLEKK